MKKSTFLLTILFFVPFILFSQGPGSTAVPFVQIGPSPGLGAYMGANTVLPSDDTFGFYYNPAQLGVFSRDNNFSTQFYPQKMNWLPGFDFDDLYLQSQAFAGGYIFEDVYEDIDLNVGLGYMHTLLDLGENVYTDDGGFTLGAFNSHEMYDAYSVGFGFEYFAHFSFGYTYKKINSNPAPHKITVDREIDDERADANAHDFGFMVDLPILKNHLQNIDKAVLLDENTSLFSNAYLGYATTNIGDMISYGDPEQADPLPRTAKFGLGFSFGLMSEFNNIPLEFIEFEVAREAQDILVKRNGVDASYQNGFGDIDLGKHMYQGNSDEEVQVNTSVRINLFETASFGIHKMKGPGFPQYVHYSAMTFSTRGIFKFINSDYQDDFLNIVLSHVDLRYSQGDINVPKEHPLHGTKYKGISLTLHGLFE
ncbi:MAG: hypothetical protein D8M58_07955 [Calditrichaeota bacterium]|nr:MAG: hypothetical protein DWQ03_18535 [Calditrichota bacterium]MBL1205315.1 hypothetical protein [Calditrichota bacterium]NOG45144.1 hypothetical protein [Calditrichota bacterium]